MTAHSDLAAIRAVGAHLRAAGTPPAAQAGPRPYPASDVQAGLERLRAALAGGPSSEPELTPEQLAAYAARYKPENARRSLGRTGGYTRPQCPGCRAFIKYEGAQCVQCGFMGNAGYLSVPAKTSHLERWR